MLNESLQIDSIEAEKHGEESITGIEQSRDVAAMNDLNVELESIVDSVVNTATGFEHGASQPVDDETGGV